MTERSTRKDLPLALVVGACGGMGLACARRLGRQYRLVLADINRSRVEADAAALAGEGISTLPVGCDVTDDGSVSTLMQSVASEGPLKVLAYVVGLSPVSGDWRAIMSVNLQGAARMAKAVLPVMDRGVGVFVSSLAAHNIQGMEPLHALLDDLLDQDFLSRLESALNGKIDPLRSYSISKYALNRMCRRLAYSWGEAGHRIVTLSPGLIASPMGEREFQASPRKWDLLKRTPLKRQGSLQEVCDVMEFLVSDRASFITGTDVLVDGGIAAAATT